MRCSELKAFGVKRSRGELGRRLSESFRSALMATQYTAFPDGLLQ